MNWERVESFLEPTRKKFILFILLILISFFIPYSLFFLLGMFYTVLLKILGITFNFILGSISGEPINVFIQPLLDFFILIFTLLFIGFFYYMVACSIIYIYKSFKKGKKLRKPVFLIFVVLLAGILLIAGLVGLCRGIMSSTLLNQSDCEKIEFENYTFEHCTDPWNRGYYVYGNKFEMDPRSVSEVPLEEGVVNKILNSNKIYSSFNPNQANTSATQQPFEIDMYGAWAEILVPIGDTYNISIPAGPGFTEERDDHEDSDTSLITCENATENITVIILEVSNTTEIESKDNCVFVRGRTRGEVTKAADKLSYNLIGVEI